MNKQKLLLIIVLFVFFLSIVFLIYFKKNQKELSTDNCEQVQVFSYRGDFVGCRKFDDFSMIPENAKNWCNQRFDTAKQEFQDYQRYQNMKCRLVGMSAIPAKSGALGCTEYCDYVCCK